MINISVLQEEVGDVLETLSGVPCIVEEQEGHKPAANFIAYNFKGWEQVGTNATEYLTPNSIDLTTFTLWKCTLEVISIGLNSNFNLIKLTHQLGKETTKELFKNIDLTYLGVSSIKPFPKILTTGWEQRYMIGIDFTLLVTDTDSESYVEFLEITHTVKNFNGTTVIEEEFTVDIIP